MTAAPTQTRLELTWELWVIENLLAGAPSAALVTTLCERGIPREAAARQVASIARAPGLSRMRTRAARGAMAEQLVRLRQVVGGRVTLDARDDPRALGRDQFHERYWRTLRPVHLGTSFFEHVPAVGSWSAARFAARFGDVPVEINTGRERARRRSEVERETTRTTLGAYLDSIAGVEGNDRYLVSRNGLLARPELASLAGELTGLPPFVRAPSLPRGASLWIGPAGTFSGAHFDPHSVLLLQLEGRKRVRLAPPDQLALVEAMDGYFAAPGVLDDAQLSARPDFDPASILTATLEPGEGLFIPAAWFHEVTALTPSMTLSIISFPWENHFHWLRPWAST